MLRERLQRICELCILLLLAFTILWKGGKSLESTWLLALVAGLCVLTQYWFQRKREIVSDQRLGVLILLFLAWTALSYVFSTTRNYGLDEVVRDSALGLLFLWHLRRRETATKEGQSFEERFLRLLSRVALVSCVIGFFIYVFQPVNRFVGTFFDWRFHTDYWPNAAAQFLLLAWPIVLLTARPAAVGRGESFRLKLPRSQLLALPLKYLLPLLPTGFILGCLFLTFSRGGVIAFLGQIVLLTVLLLFRRGTEHKLTIHLAKLAATLVIGILVFFCINALRSPIYPVESVQQKVTFTSAEGSSSASERLSFWISALQLSREKPVFGFGPGSFRFVQPHSQEGVLVTSDHPHNVFLKLSSERGIPAVIFFTAILFLLFSKGLRSVLRGKRLSFFNDSLRLGSPLLFIALAGVLAHNLIDFNLQFVGIAFPLFLTASFLVREEEISKVKGPAKKESQLLRHITALFALFLLLVATREGWYLVTSSLGRHAEVRRDGATALHWYEQSRNEWFTRDLDLSRANLHLEEGNFEEAEAAIRTYLQKNVEDARAWNLLGRTLVTLERLGEAIEAYKTAFTYGSWNDLSISNGLLQTLLAETYTQPTTDAAADSTHLPLHPDLEIFVPEIEKRVLAFTKAIEQNLHFVALSPNPEEAVQILITLSVLTPEKAPEFEIAIESIERETFEERERWKMKTPGFLW